MDEKGLLAETLSEAIRLEPSNALNRTSSPLPQSRPGANQRCAANHRNPPVAPSGAFLGPQAASRNVPTLAIPTLTTSSPGVYEPALIPGSSQAGQRGPEVLD